MPAGDHFYTTSAFERDNAVAEFFYVSEGVACFVPSSAGTGTTELFRMVNGSSGDHFYTTSAFERDNASQNGWSSEGTACLVFGSQQPNTVPLFRSFNAGNGDHFYTTSMAEWNNAVGAGWAKEGIACFVFDTARTGAVPLHRLFKPGDRHVDVNIILVGTEGFTTADRTKVNDSIAIMRTIYEQVGFGVRVAGRFAIPLAQANGHETIESGSEASDLTAEWTVPNGAVDMFVVKVMSGGADGRSPAPGSCDKNGKGMTGSVVSLNGSTANSGNTFAHEVGHYLGLQHISDPNNFIGGNGASDSKTAILTSQGNTMKSHCFARSD